MKNSLAILGAGGHGKVVADAALSTDIWTEIVLFDDDYLAISGSSQMTVKGSGFDLLSNVKQFNGVVVAIGNNQQRLTNTQELEKKGARIVSVIHPSAVVSASVIIGQGSVVLGGAVINADTKIGQACIINSAAVVEHDCCLDDAVHVSPNAALSGNTSVGKYSWIGAGSVTRQSISIGSGVIVGAGSVIVKDISDGLIVAGNPAVCLK